MKTSAVFYKPIEIIEKQLLILSSFIGYLLFHSFFEQIIDKYLVATFICHLKSSCLNDCIFGFLLLIIITNVVYSILINFFLSSKNALVSALILLLISYYRFVSNYWDFTHFSFSQYLKYIDVFLLFLVGNIIMYLAHSPRKYQTEKSNGFCFDDPIEKSEEDSMKRDELAKKIAGKISNTANPKASFAIGIVSEWGWGKTSFLNLIKNHLSDKEQIIIQFNPWLNNDEKAIVASFFDELASKLKKYNRELSGDLRKYSDMLNSISNEAKTLNSLLSIFSDGTNLRQQFDNINNAIKSSGLQIVIFIDDLDRLYESEILEVLRLIRNSASFSNAVFVVAYDRNYLISALKKANEYHPEFYMEKIFQTEIALPSFENRILTDRLQQQLNPHLAENDKNGLKNIISDSIQKGSLYNDNYFDFSLLTNFRDINRFVNSFIISYESLKGEIVLLDLLNIELLRSKFLGIYKFLANNKSPYLATKFHRNSNYVTLAKMMDKDDKELDKTLLEDYLDTSYPNVGIQKDQIAVVLRYLRCIFPDYDIYFTPQIKALSISNPIAIDRYFHYNLLDSNLSEIEFSASRQKSEVEFQAKIKEWVDNGFADEVSRKLMHIEFYLNRADFETIIHSTFYFASLPSANNDSQIGFDLENLYSKLQYKKVRLLYTEEEFQQFVCEVFLNQESPYTSISDFINYIIEREGISDWNFTIPKEELKQQKIEYFRKYAAGIDRIDRYLFHLFHYCKFKNWTPLGGGSYQPQEILPDDAKEIFKTCASRLPDSFLKNIVSSNYRFREEERKLYSIVQTVKLAWDNWDNFESFLFELNEDQVSVLREFKTFFEACKKVNFNYYVEFNFVEIDLTDALLFNS